VPSELAHVTSRRLYVIVVVSGSSIAWWLAGSSVGAFATMPGSTTSSTWSSELNSGVVCASSAGSLPKDQSLVVGGKPFTKKKKILSWRHFGLNALNQKTHLIVAQSSSFLRRPLVSTQR
jgi:hypothetical protein